jgi:hypothetical protein
MSKSIGDVTLRTNEGFRYMSNQLERVHDALERNSIYESSPSKIHEGQTYEKIMNLRPRDRSKELDREFRYQANSNIEKVIDKLNNRNALTSMTTEEQVSKHLSKMH